MFRYCYTQQTLISYSTYLESLFIFQDHKTGFTRQQTRNANGLKVTPFTRRVKNVVAIV